MKSVQYDAQIAKEHIKSLGKGAKLISVYRIDTNTIKVEFYDPDGFTRIQFVHVPKYQLGEAELKEVQESIRSLISDLPNLSVSGIGSELERISNNLDDLLYEG